MAALVLICELRGEFKVSFHKAPACLPKRKLNFILKDKQYQLFNVKLSHFPQLSTISFSSNKIKR